MKEVTEKKEKEHAEIIKEARKLLMYRKPQCRLINRALLTSEVNIFKHLTITLTQNISFHSHHQ